MSVKQSHRSSLSGSLRGLGGGSSGATHVSTVHLSGSYRSPSVYSGVVGRSSAGSISSGLGYGGGSAGGFSSGFGEGSAEGYGSWFGIGGVYSNGKVTMQGLNDRLASYLDKVNSLEQENTQLEKKIREWYDKQVPYASPDFHRSFTIIEELQNKILQVTTNNTKILLQFDNAQLAAEDFRTKLENEKALCTSVEADINGLRHAHDDLLLTNKDLEMQLQTLTEELNALKKNHVEDVSSLRTQLGARVDVHLNAPPAVDLNNVLSKMREQYETIVARNVKEAEKWYLDKSEEVNQQMTSSAQQLKIQNTEIIELRHTCQTLEIDLQTQNNMREALENTLAETEARYGSQLCQLQEMISNVELQLTQLRADQERQNFEHRTLMDVKMHLENEITTYRQLIGGESINTGTWYKNIREMSSSGSGGSGNVGGMSSSGGSGGISGSGKTRTIVEDI
ncbi:keratin, type I cytoskeletal 19-like [Bufo gargarizans]|uniref:keratin, type I cytoskeletal 19-like n=1 Tax=Bufo gargarizans TaxID=30331 RepID=UPI001CF5A7A4|nr:keratin, type I cytoskeletal 19-like [Bufo gargarizans]